MKIHLTLGGAILSSVTPQSTGALKRAASIETTVSNTVTKAEVATLAARGNVNNTVANAPTVTTTITQPCGSLVSSPRGSKNNNFLESLLPRHS